MSLLNVLPEDEIEKGKNKKRALLSVQSRREFLVPHTTGCRRSPGYPHIPISEFSSHVEKIYTSVSLGMFQNIYNLINPFWF